MNEDDMHDDIKTYIYSLADAFKQKGKYYGIDIELTATNFIDDYLTSLEGKNDSDIKREFENYIENTRGGRRRKKGKKSKKSRKSRKSKKSKKHHKRKSRRKRR